jgi:hypothetical protein
MVFRMKLFRHKSDATNIYVHIYYLLKKTFRNIYSGHLIIDVRLFNIFSYAYHYEIRAQV